MNRINGVLLFVVIIVIALFVYVGFYWNTTPDTADGKPQAATNDQTAAKVAEITPEGLIDQWDVSRSPSPNSDFAESGARKMLVDARMNRSCAGYVLAAQLFFGLGDFRAGKGALDEAVALFPDQDGPHFYLAELYYSLAFFDLIKRGLDETKLVPVNGVDQADLRNGPLHLEVAQLTGLGRPLEYATALKKLGVDDEMRMKIAMLLVVVDEGHLSDQARAYIPEMIKKSGGVAESIPLVTWQPDKQTTEILGWARREMDLAANGSRMVEPPGLLIIERDRFQKLSVGIDQLLGEHTGANKVGPSDDAVLNLARNIAENGTGSIPGLAPDSGNPDNLLHIDSNEHKRHTTKTETFSVGPMWAISWRVVPDYDLSEPSFLHVDVFDASDPDGEHPSVLVDKQWERSTLPGTEKKEDGDVGFINQGGTFYLKVTTDIPYGLDVRKPK